ncbi:hypothetical protein Z517_04861 [Fonsecaea pedrosoi CBS 271.37]|uniref:Unplaced genomic scaffold supercont1.3, whole genome shotgun sequence n=1 Tax=Fonsecaea pedrosoi CBS 271.37 TaxID=1442368 RepID=A0A0D2GTE7_9EURO|nr:uncharacterized protein Z517_04861 [Fonsecaea pedrosoi CBS 271.37]KIW81835.1 hypothetical protein Z517_04861 [Fonsecaea pedrosoi CBS 271.37]
MAATTRNNNACSADRPRSTPRTAEEEAAVLSLCDFWIRARQEHNAALALQQMRTKGAHLQAVQGWHYMSTVGGVEGCLSDDTESEAEELTAALDNWRSSSKRLDPKASPSHTPAGSVIGKAEPRYPATSIRRGNRGNKLPPLSDLARSTRSAGVNKRGATPTAKGRVAKAALCKPVFQMSLRPSNEIKSARIRALLCKARP